MTKGTREKPTANIMLSGERQKASPEDQEEDTLVSISIQRCTGSSSQSNQGKSINQSISLLSQMT